MRAFNPLFAAEVVDCVAQDRAPTVQELFAVAERIRHDAGMRPIFGWDGASSSQEECLLIRAAHAALCGTTG
jgi:thioesterase domain-containing protein